MNHVVLIGGGSDLDIQLLIALALAPAVQRIHVLVDARALERLRAVPALQAPVFHWTAADAHATRFGLTESAFEQLWMGADSIIHCAERNVFDQDLRLARRQNVEPIPRLIEVLRAHPGLRLTYLSSTCIAGDKRGLFTEFDADCGQRFHNAYERSKFEAEGLLRAADVWPRVTILRRSLVLDDSQAPLGPLLAALKKKRPLLVAGDPHAELDVVSPVALAESIATLASIPMAMGKTLHVVAGTAHRQHLRSIVKAARRDTKGGPVWFVPPALAPLAWLVTLATLGLVRSFPRWASGLQPYFRHRCAFDDFQARQLLAGLGGESSSR